MLIVIQTENLRARWRERGEGGGNCSGFWLYDLRILLPPIPKGVVCQLHLHYGILIYFRFSMWVKRQSREPFGSLLREQSQILPIDSGESPPFLIDESPQFHAISCPPQIRFNHVLQLKKQPFNSGARTFRQVGRALILLWVGQSRFPSYATIQNCFESTASARILPLALSQSVAHSPLFVFHVPADSNCPLLSSSSI